MTITTTTPPLSSSRKFEGGVLKTAQQNHARSGQLLDQKRQMVDNKHQAIISCETELAEMKAALAAAEAAHSSLESTTMEASRAFGRIVTSSRALSGLLDSHEHDIQSLNATAGQQR